MLFVAALGLSIAGAVFVYSATRVVSAGEDPQAYLKRHLLNLLIGLGLGAATMLFDYRTLRAYAPFVYIASVIGLVAVISPLGSSVNGAQAWILLPGGFSIQPSEFMKVALCVGLAMLLAERRDGETEPRLPDVGFALLIAAVPDRPGHAAARPRHRRRHGDDRARHPRCRRHEAHVAGPAARRSASPVHSSPSRSASSTSTRSTGCWRSPTPSSTRRGSATTPTRRASPSAPAGCSAPGSSKGTQTGGEFVPEQQTDFIFTVVGEELGFVGSAGLLVLFAVLLWRAMRIAIRAEDLFGTLMATGIVCWFTFQMFENIGMVIGIMPVTGVPLPFVSYGGTRMFANWMAIGLLENVHLRRSVR